MNRSQQRAHRPSRRARTRFAAGMSLAGIAAGLAGGLVPSPAAAAVGNWTISGRVSTTFGSTLGFPSSIDAICAAGSNGFGGVNDDGTFSITMDASSDDCHLNVFAFPSANSAAAHLSAPTTGTDVTFDPILDTIRIAGQVSVTPWGTPIPAPNDELNVGGGIVGSVAADGTYALEVFASDSPVTVTATYTPQTPLGSGVAAPTFPNGDTVALMGAGVGQTLAGPDIELASAGVQGTALAVNGNPVAGATISLVDASDLPVTDRFGNTVAPVVTDATGSFAFADVPAGYYSAKYGSGSRSSALTTVAAGQVETADITGIQTGIGAVSVLDDLGSPVAGAGVAFLTPAGDPVVSGYTDSSGIFQSADLLPGTYYGEVTPPAGYGLAGPTGGFLPVDLLSPHGIIVGLVRLGSVEGSVTDENGDGIAGVTIELRDVDNMLVASTTTGAFGDYSFADVVPGTYHVIEQQPAGYDQGTVNPTDDVEVTVVAHQSAVAEFSEVRQASSPTPTPPPVSTPTPVPAAGTMRLDAGLPVTRLADTRESGTMVAPGSPLRVHVAEGASAAVLQLTADGASEAGYLTAYPCTTDVPLASNVNYVTGKPSSALSTVMLTTSGDVCITSMNPVHVIVDRMAVYGAAEHSTSGRFVPVTPVRALDTRDGVTLSAGEERTISLPGIPAGATAVSINLTAVGATGGWLAAYPADTNYTGTSNLNVDNDATASSAVVVPVSADGKITLKTQNATDVIVDVMGYFTSPTDTDNSVGLFVPTHPTRVLDTRTTTMPWTAGETRTVATGVPANATAVAATVTYLADTEGYLTAWASGPMPATSNINAPANSIVPNMINVGVTNSGFQLYAQTGGHIVVDIAGYFTAPTAS